MTYRVLWAPYAEEQLEAELAGPEATVTAAAAKEIDRHLASGPNDFGESRYDTIRVGFAWPIGVQFEVMEDVGT